MNTCNCGEYMKNTQERIKDYQKLIMEFRSQKENYEEDLSKEWMYLLKDSLKDEKSWNKEIEGFHLATCLGIDTYQYYIKKKYAMRNV